MWGHRTSALDVIATESSLSRRDLRPKRNAIKIVENDAKPSLWHVHDQDNALIPFKSSSQLRNGGVIWLEKGKALGRQFLNCKQLKSQMLLMCQIT